MIVYYASYRDSSYDDERFLGVFSSTELAKQACQDDRDRRVNNRKNAAKLIWIGEAGVLSTHNGYEINPLMVDEPIVYTYK